MFKRRKAKHKKIFVVPTGIANQLAVILDSINFFEGVEYSRKRFIRLLQDPVACESMYNTFCFHPYAPRLELIVGQWEIESAQICFDYPNNKGNILTAEQITAANQQLTELFPIEI